MATKVGKASTPSKLHQNAIDTAWKPKPTTSAKAAIAGKHTNHPVKK